MPTIHNPSHWMMISWGIVSWALGSTQKILFVVINPSQSDPARFLCEQWLSIVQYPPTYARIQLLGNERGQLTLSYTGQCFCITEQSQVDYRKHITRSQNAIWNGILPITNPSQSINSLSCICTKAKPIQYQYGEVNSTALLLFVICLLFSCLAPQSQDEVKSEVDAFSVYFLSAAADCEERQRKWNYCIEGIRYSRRKETSVTHRSNDL